jgi:single-strand DNA-binding protein
MSNETNITVVGNLTADPELRFSPSGQAVANFTVASTPRVFDKTSNEWKAGETLFLRASIWREAAENVAESLTTGMRVIVQGRLKSRTYDTKEGDKRTVMELEVEEIGPSLKSATAKVARSQRSGGAPGQSGNFGGNPNQGGNFGQQQQQSPQWGQQPPTPPGPGGNQWGAPSAAPSWGNQN